ncbi:uncharacterized protein AB675_8986 [Cyphellophora attinorum]|uniref:F-box domain-containing protein n=1 Tax=Cyphellophora attinorum TaxID=1664694 RepID=A0A0N0NNF8_9EURO|nr:uncharacterized protein AB675_8986 [Phialophora attinorum]KPI41478.1 hypothetical protein AB675_8986 [Phialophora attinorum]
MSQALSAPRWNKPAPNLASMPLEILEKIIGYAIPDSIRIMIWNLPCRVIWYWDPPQWPWGATEPAGLLLVSKQVGRVARKILAQRFELRYRGGGVEDLVNVSGGYIRFKGNLSLPHVLLRMISYVQFTDRQYGQPGRVAIGTWESTGGKATSSVSY